MIASILALLGSSAVGTLIGGIFAFLNRRADIEARRVDHAHELALRQIDIELAKAEAAGKLQVAMVETDGATDVARMQAISAAQLADSLSADLLKAAGRTRWMLVVGDALRRLIRPVCTIALVGAALYINWLLLDQLVATWPELDKGQRFEGGMQAFAWVTGQASMVLGYWFISRGAAGGGGSGAASGAGAAR